MVSYFEAGCKDICYPLRVDHPGPFDNGPHVSKSSWGQAVVGLTEELGDLFLVYRMECVGGVWWWVVMEDGGDLWWGISKEAI